jgi:cell division protein FtsB
MRIVILILLVLVAVLNHRLWLSDGGGFQKVWLLQDAIKAQDGENKSLKERNETLDAEVKDLKEGFTAVEERARLELGMIRQGETFFQILEGLPPSVSTPAGQKPLIQHKVVQKQALKQAGRQPAAHQQSSKPAGRQQTAQKQLSKPAGRQQTAQKPPQKREQPQKPVGQRQVVQVAQKPAVQKPIAQKPARSQPVQGPRLTRHDD